ncbi:LysM peptidoglycan-binding domain-containing protein [Aquabacterium sp. A7-Y]|uniref:LysM peptidoglycan-binding domain-containing protein n=1 Tax=Aquabacterium sp. A7-Y TaxID=1349605 RepID=UPI00223DF831|nr:LysM peptidoglycan-binding domain-containing protein [Aquabacterium sp. A7-Y]MCW7538237.1 LysM peptidoglycan-binding domain-containing protein [Aquabacterium sp. A7-Y]
MTAIVAGQGLGWMTSSLGQLGTGGQLGQASQGRSGERVYVNAGTGNLVVQQQDEWLMGAGPDLALLRTYNSLGGADGDNNDQWRLGLSRRITGYNATDNTVRRIAEDGSEGLYRWDATRGLYVNKDGAGAFDTLAWSGSGWTYTDGDTQVREVYEVTNTTTREARLKSVSDLDGKSLTLGYTGALLTSVKTASGETVFIDYDSAAGKTANITQLRTVKADGSQTRVRYGYDSANRLSTVTVDLTPADGTVADGQAYVTTYTYVDATSRRLDTLVQSDGSKLDFDYDDSGRLKTVKESVGGQVLSTQFDYATPGITRITDTLGQRTDLSYDTATGRLLSVKTPAVGTTQLSRDYRYTADGQARELVDGQGKVTTYGYDSNGNRNYERDALGNVVERLYGSRNELLKETRYRQADPDGAGPQLPSEPMSTRYAYDAQLRLRFAVNADGRVVEHRYNGQGQRTSTLQHGGGLYTAAASDLAALEAWAAGVAKAGSQRTDYSYDFRGQLSATTSYGELDASGAGVLNGGQSVTYYVYDPSGLLLQSIEARGDELATRNTDWALKQRKALGLVDGSQNALAAEALTAEQKQALKQRYVTTYQYDGLNRLVKQTDAAGQSTLTVYNDRLRQTRVTLANGLVQLSLFDEAGRLLKLEQQDPSLATPSLGATTYEYDKLGRLVKATDPTGVSRYTLYDRASRKVGEVDGEGALTEYFYDRDNRLTGTRRYATPLSPAMLETLKADPTAVSLLAEQLDPGLGGWAPGTDGAAAGFSFGEDLDPQWTLAGETTLWMKQLGTANVAAHLTSPRLTVGAGKRYEVSAYTGAHRAAVSLEVVFYDIAGNRIGAAAVPSGGAALNNAEKNGGVQLAGYKRLWGFVTAPAGATSAAVVVRKAPTLAGQADSYVFLTRPHFNEVPAGKTLASPVNLRPRASNLDRMSFQLYDRAGRLARTLQADGNGATMVDHRYDGAGRLVETVAFGGRVSADLFGRMVDAAKGGILDLRVEQWQSVTVEDGMFDRRTRQFYSDAGLLLGTLDGDGYLTEHSYDAAGRLLRTRRYAKAAASELRAGGTLEQLRPTADHLNDTLVAYFYDAKGQLLSRFDAQSYAKTAAVHQGYLTTYQYDGAGRKVSETRHARLAAYGAGHPAAAPAVAEHVQDRVTRYEYDVHGRLVREAQQERAEPAALVTEFAYDSLGRLLQTTRGAGQADARVTGSRYDKQGRLVAELGGEGHKALAALGAAATEAQVEAVWKKWATFHRYDQAGRRIATVTPNVAGTGDKTVYYYDGESRLTHSINAEGEVTRYSYDAFGQQLRETRYGARLAAAAVGAGGRQSAIAAAVAGLAGGVDTARRAYDRQGRLSAWYDARGRLLGSQSYTAFGEVERRTEYLRDGSSPQQLLTSYRYNRRGLLEHQTQDELGPLQRGTTMLYDAFGRVMETTDARGGVVKQRYDRLGRQVGSTDALGVAHSTTYDAFSRVLTRTDGLQRTTTYTYDPAARSMTLQTPEGIKQVTQYNVWGERVSVSDGRSRTEYDYDRDGRLVATRVEVQATGTLVTRTTTSYDVAGRVFETSDGRGTVTRHSYDAAGRVLTRVVDPNTLKLTTVYRYDSRAQASWMRDANGVWTQTEYDPEGRVKAVVVDPKCGPDWVTGAAPDNPQGLALRTEYEVDLTGRVLRLTEGAGSAQPKVTSYVYDALGRRVEEVVAPGSLDIRTVYTYDSNDNVTAKKDARGFVTRYVYDAEDRLTWTVDPTGAVRRTEYDADGRVSRTTAYAMRVRAAELTALSLSTSETDLTAALAAAAPDYAAHAGNQVELRVYDRDGRLTHSIDAMGFVTRREYDGSNNIVKQTRHAKAVQGSMVPVAAPAGVPAWSLSFAAPSLLAQGDPVPTGAYLEPDADDQVEQTFHDAANRAVFSVDAAGSVTRRRFDGNGNVLETRRYFNAMTGTSVVNGLTTVNVAANDGKDRVERSLYDRGNRQLFSIDAENAVSQYEYDDMGRLKAVTRYANRLQGSFAEGQAPEVLADGGTPKATSKSWLFRSAAGAVERDARIVNTYDDAGRLTEVRNAEDVLTVRSYDEVGRLKELKEAAGTTAEQRTSYAYDMAGRLDRETRFAAKGETLVTRYVLDKMGNRERIIGPLGVELTESDSDWAVKMREQLGYGTASYTKLSSTDKGKLLALYTTVQAFDAVGRVTKVTDAEGGATSTLYDAFGNAVKITDPRGNVGYFYFDRRNQGVLHVNPDGGVVETFYTAFGTVDRIIRYFNRMFVAGDASKHKLSEINPPEILDKAPTEGVHLVRRPELDQVTRIGHDKLNRQTSITDGTGKTEKTEYDRLGDKWRYTNKAGGIFVYTHYRDGRVKTETSPEKTAQLDANSRPVMGGDGKPVMVDVVTTHVYDTRGNLRFKTEATGLHEQRVTEFQYDRLDRQVKQIGQKTRVYDGAARQESEAAPTLVTAYDAAGNVVETLDARGGRTLYYYDPLGRQVGRVDAAGIYTSWTYDRAGNRTSQKIFANAVQQAGGAKLNTAVPPAVLTAAPAAGTAVVYVIADKDGAIDRYDREVFYLYDKVGRQTGTRIDGMRFGSYLVNAKPPRYEHRSGSILTATVYDAAGNVVKQVDANGNATRFYYDRAGRKLAQLDAGLHLIVWDYDGQGNVAKETRYANPVRGLTVTDLTTLQQLKDARYLVASGDDRVTSYAYDKVNRIKSETRTAVQAGKVDDAGGLARFTRDAVTAYEYDALGNVKKKTDATGLVTEWRFDTLGRQRSETRPEFVDFEGAKVRPVTDREYDGLGLLRREFRRAKTDRAEDRVTYYDYNSHGWMTGQTDASGARTEYRHDAAGNVTRKALIGRRSEEGPPVDDIVYYVHDSLNREVRQTDHASGRVIETRYNGFGEVTGRRTNGGGAAGSWQEVAEYDRAGRVWKTNAGDGVVKLHLHDAAGNATLTSLSGTNLAEIRSSQLVEVIDRDDTAETYAVFNVLNRVTDTVEAAMDAKKASASIRPNTAGQSVFVSETSHIDLRVGPDGTGRTTNPATAGYVEASRAGTVSVWQSPTWEDAYDVPSPAYVTIDVTVPDTSAWGDEDVYVMLDMPVRDWRYPDGNPGAPPHARSVSKAGGSVRFDRLFLGYDDRVTGQIGYTVYKNTAQGRLVLAQLSLPLILMIDSEAHEIWGAEPNGGSATIPSRLVINGQSPLADRLVLFYRPEGSTGPYNWVWVPKQQNGAGNSMDSRFVQDPAFFLQDPAFSGQRKFEFQYVALGANGEVLNKQSGSLDLSNPTAPGFTQHGHSEVSGLPGRGVLHNNGWLHILDQGNANEITVRYRPKQGNGEWLVLNDAARGPRLAAIGGRGTPGWFEMGWDLLPVGDYELDIQTRRDGVEVNRAWVEFGRNADGSPWIRDFLPYESRPGMVRLGLPESTQSVEVKYREANTQGPFLSVPASLLLNKGDGNYLWDGTRLLPDVRTSKQFEVLITSYGPGGLVSSETNAKLLLGPDPKVLEAHTEVQPMQLRLTPPQAGVKSVRVAYRRRDSDEDYKPLTAVPEGGAFKVVLTGLQPPASGEVVYEYIYDTFDGTGKPLGRNEAIFTLRPTGGSSSRLEWVILGPENPEKEQVRRKVGYNAFGEVSFEEDGRGNRTDFAYNTAGAMVRQQAPLTSITHANGFVERDKRPTTENVYDLAGRLVAVTDAAGNTVRQGWLPGGTGTQIALEAHAKGVRRHSFDIFGDRRYSYNELAKDANDRSARTEYDYDAMGRLVEVRHPERAANTPGNSGATAVRTRDRYSYDEAGQRITHTGAYGNVEKTWYDSLGRVTKTRSFAGAEVKYTYSYLASIAGAGGIQVGGWQKSTVDATGRELVEHTDVFGRLSWKKDLGGHTFTYTYNAAGRLTAQSGSSKQDIVYDHYANGYIKSIWDRSTGAYTSYEYDKAGNRTLEAYVSLKDPKNLLGGVRDHHQYARITYDELNRIQTVQDPRATIQYEYDAVGNRRRVYSYYHDGVDGSRREQDYWYTYDELNRFTLTMGRLAGKRGTSLTDKSGVIERGTTGVSVWYDAASRRQEVINGEDGSHERYTYTADGYLEDTYLNAKHRSRRHVDLLGRVLQYTELNEQGAVSYERKTGYSLDHRIRWQEDNQGRTDYFYYLDNKEDAAAATADGHGALARTLHKDKASKPTTTNTYYAYEYWDSAKQFAITNQAYNPSLKGNNAAWGKGFSNLEYDVNGHLKMAIDVQANRRFRYISDAQGLILVRDEVVDDGRVNQVHRYYYVNGQRVGDVGNDGPTRVDYAQALANRGQAKPDYKAWRPIASADFDQNYEPIGPDYPSNAPSSYTVRDGDDLPSVAAAMWGDRAMWYLIADANGLTGTEELLEGQRLIIPPKVTNIHNNSGTFRVYDPAEAMGNVHPTLPPAPRPPGGGCGVLGIVVVLVVAVVATIMTAGALAPQLAAAGSSGLGALFSAGTAALGGAAGGMTAAVVGGAVGSIASQGVGMALGVTDEFSWSGVALGAIGAGVGAAIGPSSSLGASLGKDVGGAMARAAIGNAATQGVAVATGLQQKFDWRSVAASAVGGAVSHGVNKFIGNAQVEAAREAGMSLSEAQLSVRGDAMGGLLRNTASGLAGGSVQALVQGYRPNWVAIAAHSFGSAVGDALVDGVIQADLARHAKYGFGGLGAVLGAGDGSIRLGTGDDGSGIDLYTGGDDWAADVLQRRAGMQSFQIDGSAGSGAAAPARQGDGMRTVTVARGQVLSRLVGTNDADKLDRVAQFNGLASRHHVPAGMTLRIPDEATLANVEVGADVQRLGVAGAKYFAQRQAAQAAAAQRASLSMVEGPAAGAGGVFQPGASFDALSQPIPSILPEMPGASEAPGLVNGLFRSHTTYLRRDLSPVQQAQLTGLRSTSLTLTAGGALGAAAAPLLLYGAAGEAALLGRSLYAGGRAVVSEVAALGPVGAVLANPYEATLLGIGVTEFTALSSSGVASPGSVGQVQVAAASPSRLASVGAGHGAGQFANFNGRDIAAAIDGVTEQSSRIAAAIRNGDLKISVLGDDLFNKAKLSAEEVRQGNIVAIAQENRLYLRKSSASLLTDTVHEGTHGLDFINGYGATSPKTRWQWEKRAFFYERQYQLSSGQIPQFSTPRDMVFHIWEHYDNDIYNP